MDAATLFARLQLRPDASTADVRRAYARELKKIDQETQAEAFQALRETYEQLMGWLQHQQSIAQQAPVDAAEETRPAPQTPTPVSPGMARPADAHASAGDVEDTSPSPACEAVAAPETTRREPVSNEALGREVLEQVIHRLMNQPFADHQDATNFLARCLDDPRLISVDARRYFEWGMASILANGWRPGHELLFAPAMACFGWREDRTRLLGLGHPGRVVDAAITDLEVFDSQPSADRATQRDVIRALRRGERPSVSDLVKGLPVAEYVVDAFPNWLHVVAKPDTLLAWRAWDAEVPGWRRKLVRRGRPPRAAKPVTAAPAAAGSSSHAPVFLVLMLISVLTQLGKCASSSPSSADSARPLGTQSVLYDPPLQDLPLEERMRVLRPLLVSPAPAAAPPKDVDPAQARKTAAELAKGKAGPQRCEQVATLAQDNPSTHQSGRLGPAFDRLVMDCLVKHWGGLTAVVYEPSYQREQRRRDADVARLLDSVRVIAPRTDVSTSGRATDAKPKLDPPIQRMVDEPGRFDGPLKAPHGVPVSTSGSASKFNLVPDAHPIVSDHNGLGLKYEAPPVRE